MKNKNIIPFSGIAVLAIALASVSHAATVLENFEGSTAGSGTPPTGWSLITEAGTPTYATSAAGAGSNGSGGSSGLAGQVSSTALVDNQLPGAYLVNSTTFDLTKAVSGSFDFFVVAEDAQYDDVAFMLGDIADGYDHTVTVGSGTQGELLNAKFSEYNSPVWGGGSYITDGRGRETPVGTYGAAAAVVANDKWYRATVSWNPTSGTTGDFSITLNDFSSDLFTLTATGFTFDSADAQIGFGSVNDTIRFDNVNFIPEPSAALLGGLGLLALLRRRRA